MAEVTEYRHHVDRAVLDLLACGTDDDDLTALVELGLHHEQQHQELILMDVQHLLSTNPCLPAYGPLPWDGPPSAGPSCGWIGHDGGIVEIGHASAGGRDGFAFDNEGPVHAELLRPFEIADGLVTAGDWAAFVADDGYRRPELWMSDGWATAPAPGLVRPPVLARPSTTPGTCTASTACVRSTPMRPSPT